jgi:hypothetical protein
MGRTADARADAARALKREQAPPEPLTPSSDLGQAYLVLGQVLAAQGRGGEAREALATALRHLESTLGESHPRTRAARQLIQSLHVE